MGAEHKSLIGLLVLPSDSEDEWKVVEHVLGRPIEKLADIDAVMTEFSRSDREPRVCRFFSTIPGSSEAGEFEFKEFWDKGWPLIKDLALDMKNLFDRVEIPIFKMRSSWGDEGELVTKSFSLSRRQCACLLAHSFLGSLKKPADVELNDFRFTASDMFMGTSVSPNSATTFLNYFLMLGKHGIPNDTLTFERRGYRKGKAPWTWENNEKPLCKVELVDGNIDDNKADLHVEFSNAFVGGGVMTGDAAMEELLFLRKPELMVAMAIQNRMVDQEAVLVSGARKYSCIKGYGQGFEFAGSYENEQETIPRVCAIDAVRGGGKAMAETSLLRDMNKARIAFEGAREVATGHWGCGAFGNNHDLMFLKQWLAASEAGAANMYYHDFSRNQSHNIFPLVRRMKHLSVGELWDFLLELTSDLREPHNMVGFCERMRKIAVGKLQVPQKK